MDGIELEESDEVVWTEREDNAGLLFPVFIRQQGISRTVQLLDARCGEDGDRLLLSILAFYELSGFT